MEAPRDERDPEQSHPGHRFRRHYPAVSGHSEVSLSDDSDDQSLRDSFGLDCSSDVDLESGVLELKLHLDKLERDCRICHLGLESETPSSGAPIDLGCSCKGDLGSAHKQCADTWFKIKGDVICEICGATAVNIVGEGTNEANNATAAASTAPVILVETIWHSRRIMNFLLACMVLAFIISWLFHFKVLT
ncbi:hypothetical protein UlMin_013304 [Ulmus minor]